MTVDQQLKLVEMIAATIRSLFWPVVVVFLVLFFGRYIKKFLENLGELTVRAAGVEATARKQQQMEAAASLLPDVESRIRDSLESQEIIAELKAIAAREAGKSAEQEVARLMSSVAEKTVEDIRRSSFITVDSRPLVGSHGEVWQFPFSQFATVSDFLDNLWFLMDRYGIPSMKYGILWILRDKNTGTEFRSMGRRWASGLGKSLDDRGLGDVGLQPGMELEIIRLK